MEELLCQSSEIIIKELVSQIQEKKYDLKKIFHNSKKIIKEGGKKSLLVEIMEKIGDHTMIKKAKEIGDIGANFKRTI